MAIDTYSFSQPRKDGCACVGKTVFCICIDKGLDFLSLGDRNFPNPAFAHGCVRFAERRG